MNCNISKHKRNAFKTLRKCKINTVELDFKEPFPKYIFKMHVSIIYLNGDSSEDTNRKEAFEEVDRAKTRLDRGGVIILCCEAGLLWLNFEVEFG